MRRLVIDAPTLLSWFEPDGPGATLRAEYEAGALGVVAPRTIVADALALLSTRPGWTAERLQRVAMELGRLRFELRDPPTAELARYLAGGLAPDRAAYAALAAELDLRLATTDPALIDATGGLVLSP